jgi:dihydropteroate synthase
MAILNITPDSFSDGGVHEDPIRAGFALAEAGADIVDIGGESTRPGAATLLVDEELARIRPAVRELARAGIAVSVDTRNAETMRVCLGEGARIFNDVSGLTHDPASRVLAARSGCAVVVMHMRGTPQDMNVRAVYADVVSEVRDELAARVAGAEAAGVAREAICVDPGFGFAKNSDHNIALLRHLPELSAPDLPLLVGVSRKRFIGELTGEAAASRRLGGSLAASLWALQHGADIVRVHDVAPTVQAIKVWRGLSA